MSDKFKETGMGNQLAEMDGFDISYNPSTLMDIPMWKGDGSGEETAIIKDRKYFILNGDFRQEYLERETFDSCIEFFLANADKKSSWSDTPPTIETT